MTLLDVVWAVLGGTWQMIEALTPPELTAIVVVCLLGLLAMSGQEDSSG